MTTALGATLLDLGFGLVAASAFFLICWIVSSNKKAPHRERPPRVDPVDFEKEIRVIDKSRRGPGPHIEPLLGRERLAYDTKRRAA